MEKRLTGIFTYLPMTTTKNLKNQHNCCSDVLGHLTSVPTKNILR